MPKIYCDQRSWLIRTKWSRNSVVSAVFVCTCAHVWVYECECKLKTVRTARFKGKYQRAFICYRLWRLLCPDKGTLSAKKILAFNFLIYTVFIANNRDTVVLWTRLAKKRRKNRFQFILEIVFLFSFFNDGRRR